MVPPFKGKYVFISTTLPSVANTLVGEPPVFSIPEDDTYINSLLLSPISI
jgi:hypothetical protein